jgi:hypothetical protein
MASGISISEMYIYQVFQILEYYLSVLFWHHFFRRIATSGTGLIGPRGMLVAARRVEAAAHGGMSLFQRGH